jgi:hypothetical protein
MSTTEKTLSETAIEAATENQFGRRKFLFGAGLTAAAVALAACAGDDENDVATGGEGGEGGDIPAGDLDVVAFAAGLELLAVGTYQAALDAAGSGALGEVPPAGAEFVTTAMGQHKEIADALNGVLTSNGREEVTEANADVKAAVVDPAFAAAKNFGDAANLARTLETAAAATYLKAVQSQLQSKDVIRTAAGIQATGQKRVAILNYVLGEYPVPDTFQKTDAAIAP